MQKRYALINTFLIIIFTVSVIYSSRLNAQVLPVGTQILEDKYRRDQLLGRVDSTISFTIRPLSASALQRKNVFDPNNTISDSTNYFYTADGEGFVRLLPASFKSQVNSAYPTGWNDGSMIPSRGAGMMLSAGIFAKYKFISLQLQPEIVTAANSRYDGIANVGGYGLEWYRAVGNKIDMPEYFGNSVYAKAYLGQSSLRLNFDPVSFGVSTENLWWGPGIRNSLLMSNTAPGFLHFTINTTKPVSTPIGSFEGQLVGGKLKKSGFLPSITNESLHQEMYYIEKPETDRYFSGLILTYQPKWVPGLALGYISSFVVNTADMSNGINDYLPFLNPSKNTITYLDDNGIEKTSKWPRDSYGSVFFRWVLPAAKLEVYGEYGRNNFADDFRDFVVRPNHSRAFVLGFRKLIPLEFSDGDYFQVGFEATELSKPPSRFLRNSATWYSHHIVRDGYTHRGQALGAGIGPGSNLQSLNLSWIRDIKQVGLQIERLVRNEDFFYTYVNDLRRSWVDLSFMAYSEWDFDRFLARASLQYSHAYNYRHEFLQPPTSTGFWDFDPQDKGNLNLSIGLIYLF